MTILTLEGIPRGLATAFALGLAMQITTSDAAAQDRPIDLGAGQSLEQLTGETGLPLQITGFGTGGYSLDGRTNDNTFLANKFATSLFRELSESFWMFGQLTTLLGGHHEEAGHYEEAEGGAAAAEPAEGGGRWNLNPRLNLLVMVTNGWESQIDPNRGKTIAGRLGILPSENSSFGVGGMFGPEGGQGEANNRSVISVDYSWQPVNDLILGGEANWGADHLQGAGDHWVGGTLTVFGKLHRRFGVTLRGEIFDDREGARTGEVQKLKSLSLAPVYFIGTGRNGIFSNVEHTTFRIPRFQLRGEVRLDQSNIDFFETEGGLDDWNVRYILQLVATF
jgi:hypothetical protein